MSSSRERSQTPSSSDTPPASADLLPTDAASPSIAGIRSAHPDLVAEFRDLDSGARRQKLHTVGLDLARTLADQELCKQRVTAAQDLEELARIQQELARLTQRQMELSNEQAALLVLFREHRDLAADKTDIKAEPIDDLQDERTKDTRRTRLGSRREM